jgi:Fe2+ transport system protein B
MNEIKKYKRPILSILIIIAVLMIMIAVGFTIGILSTNPDGLERVLIDENGESWLEHLTSPWVPILSWITSDYVAGIFGIIISVTLIIFIFYSVRYFKKNRN